MHLTDVDKELIKAFRKSSLTFIGGGLLGFIALALMKILTVNHTEIQLLTLMAIEVLVLRIFLRYRKLLDPEKAMENNSSTIIKREFLKAFFNSLLMFYTFYSIFFAFNGISTIQGDWSIVSNSYYYSVLLLNLIFVTLSYIFNNTILNFITSNSEKIDAKLKAEAKAKKLLLEEKQKITHNITIGNS
ncbi:hypothetical protein [Marinomonas sp. ef1]|uniref:hypothetical protein n=1 Tax=Marinomonas sp. ef1 TaxID=2005043 RepID=UPI000C28A432|nr:hypothetical protein [Marinomonas sp. ef1]